MSPSHHSLRALRPSPRSLWPQLVPLLCASVVNLNAATQQPAAETELGDLLADKPAAKATTPQKQPAAEAELGDILTLAAFEVSVTKEVDYLSQNAESATRLSVALADIPQNVTVFNEEFLRDINAQTLDDIAVFDPSLNVDADNDTITIRGQGGGSNYFNGFPQFGGIGSQTLVNTARVEVIKGPSAVLYGTGSFGGIINRVSKKPYSRSGGSLYAGVDNNGRYNVNLTLNQPVLPQKFLFRTDIGWSDGKIWGIRPWQSLTIVPSLEWRPAKRITFNLDFTYQRETGVGNWGMPIINGVPGKITVYQWTPADPATGLPPLPGSLVTHNIDLRRYVGELSFDNRDTTRLVTYGDLKLQLSRHWLLRSMFNGEYRHSDILETAPEPSYTTLVSDRHAGTDRYLLRRYARKTHMDSRSFRLRDELVGYFKLLSLDHKLILGHALEYINWKQTHLRTNNSNTNTLVPGAPYYPYLDLVTGERIDYALLSTGQPAVVAAPKASDLQFAPTTSVSANYEQTDDLVSFYLNDIISLIPNRLILVGGLRWIEYGRDRYDAAAPDKLNYTYPRRPVNTLTHSVGLVGHILRNRALTAYLNRTQTFLPNYTVNELFNDSGDVDIEYLKPQYGLLHEAGIRVQLPGRLSVSACVYDILQKNVLETIEYWHYDPTSGQQVIGYKAHTIDGLHSKGAEFAFNWRQSAAFSIFGGYAYTHTINKVTGARHYRVPLHAVSLFGRYAFNNGRLAGLNVTGGFVWRDASIPQQSSDDATYLLTHPMWTVPPYLDVSVGLNYAIRLNARNRLTLSLRGSNLTDRLNYMAATTSGFALREPRRFTASAAISF